MNNRILFNAGIRYIFTGKLKSLGIGIEVTNSCNLKCKHCYRNLSPSKDLSIEGWKTIFEDFKRKNIISMGYVGGEPLLRKELIEEGKKHFAFNWVVTNGTIPLPRWNDVVFGVSLDGTKEYHNKIRGDNFGKKQYELITKNIQNAVKDNLRVYVLMTISKINQKNISAFAKEWHGSGVKGIIYDFYTPSRSEKEEVWLNFDERDKAIREILSLRKKYGRFLPWNTKRLMNKMSSRNCKKYIYKCMGMIEDRINLDYHGKKLYPCIMGSAEKQKIHIDCSRCGCMMAYIDFIDILTSGKMFV